ncbi:hypothetical protein RI685_16165 (plasmid) [Clavibacter michiganensis]|uniref:hypothetical protein n=1 Tax=Clavibacter michiganensis TaxID=28447 RepID=UPI003D9FCA71
MNRLPSYDDSHETNESGDYYLLAEEVVRDAVGVGRPAADVTGALASEHRWESLDSHGPRDVPVSGSLYGALQALWSLGLTADDVMDANSAVLHAVIALQLITDAMQRAEERGEDATEEDPLADRNAVGVDVTQTLEALNEEIHIRPLVNAIIDVAARASTAARSAKA